MVIINENEQVDFAKSPLFNANKYKLIDELNLVLGSYVKGMEIGQTLQQGKWLIHISDNDNHKLAILRVYIDRYSLITN